MVGQPAIPDDVYLVTFSPDDPEDPRNWSKRKKIRVVSSICALSFIAVFGSSVYAPAETLVRQLYGVNAEVASLGLSLYVLGFAFGPLLSPLSEVFGRRIAYTISWPLFMASVAVTAWVDNFAVIMVFRFLTGCTSGCALNNGTGLIADLYNHQPETLFTATGWYSFCPMSGPCIGSLIGNFVAAHEGNQLWVLRVHWFAILALWPLVFFLPETHGPTILKKRAARLRKEGKTNAFAPNDLRKLTLGEMARKHVGRPTAMLLREPIVQCSALWITLAYSIIYLFFEVFPTVYVDQKHLPFQLGGLPFLGITLGMIICTLASPWLSRRAGMIPIPLIEPPGGLRSGTPEALLKVVLPSCCLLPVSMLWFAWTSGSNTSWVSPTIAGILFGFTMLSIWYQFLAYVAQTFTLYASSASAAITMIRSLVTTAFPVIAHPLLNNLGTEWGVSIFGFVAIAMIPVPIVFIRFGSALRKHSKYGSEAQRIIDAMHAEEDHNTSVPNSEGDEQQVMGGQHEAKFDSTESEGHTRNQ